MEGNKIKKNCNPNCIISDITIKIKLLRMYLKKNRTKEYNWDIIGGIKSSGQREKKIKTKIKKNW